METQDLKNKIYFLYDKWDKKTNTPFINLTTYKINNDCFENPIGFFDFYERYYKEAFKKDKKWNLLHFSLEDISQYPNDTFYYPIKTRKRFNEIFKTNPFSDSLIKVLRKNNNVKVLFIKEHECDTSNELNHLYKFIKKNNLRLESFLSLSNNSNHKSEFLNLDLISKTSSSIFSTIETKFKKQKDGKFFLMHNHTSKPHRLYFLGMLEHYGILSNVNYSYLHPSKNIIDESDVSSFNSLVKNEEIKLVSKLIVSINKKWPKYSEYEKQYDCYRDDGSVDNSNFKKIEGLGGVSGGFSTLEEPKSLEESYINIVSESLFEDSEQIHITEKSIRPFYFNQIPIILATPNHIKKMKEKWNFDFFDDVINHDYDNIESHSERFYRILDEIKRLFSEKDKIIEFYQKNEKRFKKNQEIVKKICYDKNDFNLLDSLCVK